MAAASSYALALAAASTCRVRRRQVIIRGSMAYELSQTLQKLGKASFSRVVFFRDPLLVRVPEQTCPLFSEKRGSEAEGAAHGPTGEEERAEEVGELVGAQQTRPSLLWPAPAIPGTQKPVFLPATVGRPRLTCPAPVSAAVDTDALPRFCQLFLSTSQPCRLPGLCLRLLLLLTQSFGLLSSLPRSCSLPLAVPLAFLRPLSLSLITFTRFAHRNQLLRPRLHTQMSLRQALPRPTGRRPQPHHSSHQDTLFPTSLALLGLGRPLAFAPLLACLVRSLLLLPGF